VSTWVFSCSPANRPAPWRWTSSLVGQAAPQPVRVRWGGPGLVSTLVGATHGQPSIIPSRQVRCGQSTAPPADHGGTSKAIAPNGDGPPHRAIPGSSAVRTARLQSRGHQRPVPSGHLDGTGRLDTGSMDTGRVDTGRPRDRLDGRPHGGQRTRTGDHPLGGQTSPGSQRLGGAWPPITAAVTTPAPRPWSPLNNCGAPPLGRASAHCSRVLDLDGTRRGQWDYGS
jgi:hypothetical protein